MDRSETLPDRLHVVIDRLEDLSAESMDPESRAWCIRVIEEAAGALVRAYSKPKKAGGRTSESPWGRMETISNFPEVE